MSILILTWYRMQCVGNWQDIRGVYWGKYYDCVNWLRMYWSIVSIGREETNCWVCEIFRWRWLGEEGKWRKIFKVLMLLWLWFMDYWWWYVRVLTLQNLFVLVMYPYSWSSWIATMFLVSFRKLLNRLIIFAWFDGYRVPIILYMIRTIVNPCSGKHLTLPFSSTSLIAWYR